MIASALLGYLGGHAGAASGAGVAGAATAARHVYVVRPGDTLWGIAARIAGPHGDPRPVVDRLAAANHVHDGVISPGERLVVP